MSVARLVSKVRRLQRLRPKTKTRTTSAAHEARERARAEAAEAATRGAIAPLFPEYFDKPVEFALIVLGLRLCRAQRRILKAIARSKRVAIRSGQKTGKSTAFVAAALWWAATRPRGRVLLTAPGYRQVKKVLWKELRRICFDSNNTREDKRTVAEVLNVEPALDPETGMQWPDGREIVGFAASSPGATQGFSGPEMLIVIDEGSDVDDDIMEAHEGNTAAGGSICAASNPIKSIGWFFEAFHSQAEYWTPIHLSSEDTPNVLGDEPPIPGLADKAFINDMRRKHGVKSKFYLERILGQFSGSGSNTVVGLALVDSATARYRTNVAKAWHAKHGETPPADGIPLDDLALVADLSRNDPAPLEFGLDVARYGDDDTTIAPRRGKRLFPLISIHGAEGNQIAGKLLEVVRMCRRIDEVPAVKIDCTGGYGTSPADILRANHSSEVLVVEVNSSSRADDDTTYANMRAQMHFGFAQFLKEGGELPDDTKLRVELLAPTYKFDANRRYLVEPKDAIKKRIKRSPDKADAAALAVLKATPGLVTYDEAYDDDIPLLRI